MLPMSTAWQWSSQECATSVTRAICASLLLALTLSAEAATIEAGPDIQAAIRSAESGDTILVGPGDHSSFEVDRPLTIIGQGGPVLRARIQQPAVRIRSDRVSISGFRIIGVGKDQAAKFDYYMQNPALAAGRRLDLPNAAVLVMGNDVTVQDTTIFGAQVGVLAEDSDRLKLRNLTLYSCDSGVTLTRCLEGALEGCLFSGCSKYGLYADTCQKIKLSGSRFLNTTNAGALFKGSELCLIEGSVFSGNTFGLSIWNSTQILARGNRADHNYYGLLISQSSNNTIIGNVAADNSREEIVSGFGVGISLQENSSENVIAGNTAKGNFNGLEVSKGCRFNVIFGNNATDNSHGIRMNENRNNLIYCNNLVGNMINAYENDSLNIWNTTLGNHYSDYQGRDEDGDGLGESPYALPGGRSHDHHPLMERYATSMIDEASLRHEVGLYATYPPADDEVPDYRVEEGTIVISSRVPTSPPRWSDSRPLDINKDYAGI
ncbi:MAG: NosD domain-containing protein [Methanothrix sp.]|nr:NosD domain-containing protein [Methanothrix sp.]